MSQPAAKPPIGSTPPAAELAGLSDDGSVESRLEARLSQLNDGALTQMTRSLELSRAIGPESATDQRILASLRPRLRELRPPRVATFQRAVCMALEPFICDHTSCSDRRRGGVPRNVLGPWWKLLTARPDADRLSKLAAAYGAGLASGDPLAVRQAAQAGTMAASELTLAVVAELEGSIGRRADIVALFGSDRAPEMLVEIGAMLRLDPKLSPAFEQVRRAAPASDGRIGDLSGPALQAARDAYLSFQAVEPLVVEYFFIGLVNQLAQPWQALRLVRLLSTDMAAKGADPQLEAVPARLLSDLARCLSEVGRAMEGQRGMNRRLWLLTCSLILSDAGLMVDGLAQELKQSPNPAWERSLLEAKQKLVQAVDMFVLAAVRDCAAVLPVREVRGKADDVKLEPDLTRAVTDDDIATAQAAAALFTAARRVADKEGLERAFRSREAELEQRIQIGIAFRNDYMRARGRHVVALQQLNALVKVLGNLPQTEEVLTLAGRAQRALERYGT